MESTQSLSRFLKEQIMSVPNKIVTVIYGQITSAVVTELAKRLFPKETDTEDTDTETDDTNNMEYAEWLFLTFVIVIWIHCYFEYKKAHRHMLHDPENQNISLLSPDRRLDWFWILVTAFVGFFLAFAFLLHQSDDNTIPDSWIVPIDYFAAVFVFILLLRRTFCNTIKKTSFVVNSCTALVLNIALILLFLTIITIEVGTFVLPIFAIGLLFGTCYFV